MYIGVDGGGTKTAFVLLNNQGEILARHQGQSCSYLTVGIDQVRSMLENGIEILLNNGNANISDIKYAFFGIPCYGEDQNMLETLNQLPSSIFDRDKYSCDNDTVCGWAGSLAGQDGINIISGTGSISYGENNGKSARCGGWGEIFGDEGSGHWIAREGLNIYTKMSDGRLKMGLLHQMIKQKLALSYDLDLPGLILDEWKGSRRKIAALSTVVFDAAHAGDEEAINILERAGYELAQIVEATRQKIGFDENTTVKLSYSGGVFNAGKLILDPFKKALKSDYTLLEPRFSPVIGAALYAAKLDGAGMIKR
ncbi:MAG: hypothetical protein JKY84_08160 [Emcibacteraceae bacterium]|nr:hypothetical protein [Emcibacteraceae bacterium]